MVWIFLRKKKMLNYSLGKTGPAAEGDIKMNKHMSF